MSQKPASEARSRISQLVIAQFNKPMAILRIEVIAALFLRFDQQFKQAPLVVQIKRSSFVWPAINRAGN